MFELGENVWKELNRENFKAWRTQSGISGLWMMCSMIGGAITLILFLSLIPENESIWVVPIMAVSSIIMTVVIFVISFIIGFCGPFDFEYQTNIEDYD